MADTRESSTQTTKRENNGQKVDAATSLHHDVSIRRPSYGKQRSIGILRDLERRGPPYTPPRVYPTDESGSSSVMLQRWVQEDIASVPYHSIASSKVDRPPGPTDAQSNGKSENNAWFSQTWFAQAEAGFLCSVTLEEFISMG